MFRQVRIEVFSRHAEGFSAADSERMSVREASRVLLPRFGVLVGCN